MHLQLLSEGVIGVLIASYMFGRIFQVVNGQSTPSIVLDKNIVEAQHSQGSIIPHTDILTIPYKYAIIKARV